jgi:hypothetical protein
MRNVGTSAHSIAILSHCKASDPDWANDPILEPLIVFAKRGTGMRFALSGICRFLAVTQIEGELREHSSPIADADLGDLDGHRRCAGGAVFIGAARFADDDCFFEYQF